MKYIFITLILLNGCTYGLNKPIHGHLMHMKQVNNYAREIEYSKDLRIIEPGFVNILKQQPIIFGKGIKTIEVLKKVNNEVNSKNKFDFAPHMTPNEFKIAKFADCKAYTTTKYYALRALGWKPEELNIWSGDYNGRAHLMLTARIGDKVYALDIMDQSLPEAKDYFFKNFIPSYRFNEKGLDIE